MFGGGEAANESLVASPVSSILEALGGSSGSTCSKFHERSTPGEEEPMRGRRGPGGETSARAMAERCPGGREAPDAARAR